MLTTIENAADLAEPTTEPSPEIETPATPAVDRQFSPEEEALIAKLGTKWDAADGSPPPPPAQEPGAAKRGPSQIARKIQQNRILGFRIRAKQLMRDPDLEDEHPDRARFTNDPQVTNWLEVTVFATSKAEAWALFNDARDSNLSLKRALADGATITEITPPTAA